MIPLWFHLEVAGQRLLILVVPPAAVKTSSTSAAAGAQSAHPSVCSDTSALLVGLFISQHMKQ